MKINIFVDTDNGGHHAVGLADEFNQNQIQEDDIIEGLDEDAKIKKKKELLIKFLAFKNVTLKEIFTWPKIKRDELRKEFISSLK